MSTLLPTWQDCHEMWSKKRKRQMKEQMDDWQNQNNSNSAKPKEVDGGYDFNLFFSTTDNHEFF